MKVALFGGTGFVGSYIVKELIKQGYTPKVLVRPGSEKKLVHSEKCEIISGIPMPGGEDKLKSDGVRSLNLSVACGIVCYAACQKLDLLNN